MAEGSNVPIPDPTVLTTAMIERNRLDLRADLRTEFADKLQALRDVLQTRFDAGDRATIVLAETVNRVPTLLDREATRLAELFAEKLAAVSRLTDDRFENVAERFRGRDARRLQDGEKAAAAVASALAAQKEALAALGATLVKQIDSILALMGSNTKATDEKIAAINSRLDRGEGLVRGGYETRSEKRLDMNLSIAFVAVIATVVALAVQFLHSATIAPH